MLHANFSKIVLKYSNEVHLLRYLTQLGDSESLHTCQVEKFGWLGRDSKPIPSSFNSHCGQTPQSLHSCAQWNLPSFKKVSTIYRHLTRPWYPSPILLLSSINLCTGASSPVGECCAPSFPDRVLCLLLPLRRPLRNRLNDLRRDSLNVLRLTNVPPSEPMSVKESQGCYRKIASVRYEKSTSNLILLNMVSSLLVIQ
jgi:hypothetical protein